MKEKVIFALDRREIILLIVVLLIFALSVFFLGFVAGSGRCKKTLAKVPEERHIEKIVVAPAAVNQKGVEYTFVTSGGTKEMKLSEPVTEEEIPARSKKKILRKVYNHNKSTSVKSGNLKSQQTSAKKVKEKRNKIVNKVMRKPKYAPPPVKINKPFTVQVAAYRDKKDALLLVYRLRKAGFKAFYERSNIPGRGVWYRVRVGHYKSRGEAKKWADKVHRKMGLPTFVTISK